MKGLHPSCQSSRIFLREHSGRDVRPSTFRVPRGRALCVLLLQLSRCSSWPGAVPALWPRQALRPRQHSGCAGSSLSGADSAAAPFSAVARLLAGSSARWTVAASATPAAAVTSLTSCLGGLDHSVARSGGSPLWRDCWLSSTVGVLWSLIHDRHLLRPSFLASVGPGRPTG